MDVVGSEIGHKMRSAIKAKLTELGCYVDDELPDYVMVMVANKRTRSQMEDDLQLFLGDNTELFVNWLHQVLKKLQEVTVTAPALKTTERDKSKERSDPKDHKCKEKKSKDKHKKSDIKKAKKKDKEKLFRKKEEKKIHKTKKKSKRHEMIRPNIPPLLMNMEKESEPSITDVFAGQILKNHGISIDTPKEDTKVENKPIIQEIKRPILPIIDPATISSQPERETDGIPDSETNELANDPKGDQIKEIHEIEAKIQGLKQKLTEQLDSMSDDEDFLNIRTEAEELMNDFAEDVFQEISQQTPVVKTPPVGIPKSPTPPIQPISQSIEVSKSLSKDPTETLPQIELKLPKRPVRERLGLRGESKTNAEVKEKERTESPERFTPDREPEVRPQKSAKSRLGDPPETSKRSSLSDDGNSDKSTDCSNKKLTSRVSVLENRPSRSSCASVVRVRPRPRVSAPASSLLLRAVADAHKSLLNTPSTKADKESQIKRALVLPMRRCVEAQKILIQVPADNSQETGDSISLGGDMDSDDDKSEKMPNDHDREQYAPTTLTKKVINNELPPLRNDTRTTSRKDDTLIIETINIHNTSTGKDKNTQFIVTMDGYHPNAFLAKKLQTEGLLNDGDEISKIVKEKITTSEAKDQKPKEKEPSRTPEKVPEPQIKRLSNTSEESETQVIIKKEDEKPDKRKSVEVKEEPPVLKKRKASPIVFDVNKRVKESERVRDRTESASSDGQVTVTTVTNTHKYDTVPPLSSTERKLVWCRMFPSCRYGSACAFTHPRCKFLAACTRRNCVYSHSPNAPLAPPQPPHSSHPPNLAIPPHVPISPVVPSIASHVVPAANYKSISGVLPNMCKFYPNCVNPACHFYHPKPCRYGNNCANKLECNFYHADVLPKWRYPV